MFLPSESDLVFCRSLLTINAAFVYSNEGLEFIISRKQICWSSNLCSTTHCCIYKNSLPQILEDQSVGAEATTWSQETQTTMKMNDFESSDGYSTASVDLNKAILWDLTLRYKSDIAEKKIISLPYAISEANMIVCQIHIG